MIMISNTTDSNFSTIDTFNIYYDIDNSILNHTEFQNYSNQFLITSMSQWKKNYRYFINACILMFPIIIQVCVGCGICLKNILDHLKKPGSLCIGMLSQFIILPPSTFIILILADVGNVYSLVILVLSCCPGGTISNACTHYLNGDLHLSICMTFISTLMANVLLPFNLWLYGTYFETKEFVIPYKNIFISLLFIIIPVIIGIFVRWINENLAERIAKAGGRGSVIFLCLMIVSESIMASEIYLATPWKVMLVSYSISPSVMLIAYIFAFLTKRSLSVRIAIFIETSSQNIPLSAAIVTLSFSLEMQVKVLGIILHYMMGAMISFLLVVFYQIIAKAVKQACRNLSENIVKENTMEECKNEVLNKEFPEQMIMLI